MVFQAFLVALVAFFAYSSNKFLGDAMVNRPLVTATLTGLVLGNLQTGLIMAGTLELTWMGIMYLGLHAVGCCGWRNHRHCLCRAQQRGCVGGPDRVHSHRYPLRICGHGL